MSEVLIVRSRVDEENQTWYTVVAGVMESFWIDHHRKDLWREVPQAKVNWWEANRKTFEIHEELFTALLRD